MPILRVQITGTAQSPQDFEEFIRRIPADRRPVSAETLEQLLDRHGVSDHELELMDEFGLPQRFSLGPLVDLDPSTPIRIQYRTADVDRELPPLDPGVVLLEEYLVAE
ncbi:cytidylate kinase-like family protein [Antrihabitans cavernicola]|uniref:Cytidylate kinase-like family protein n=1 Tax=Antrihabitans cavernicola TaxID=2495913 RepID=A0A5A7SGX4_9NOCA|nr:cytidylate kinase-like family protein [Spelaeibacter cavernicola]KAA0024874.1 cytidylate kinase-like family protein [Spelaeibacter cavernicola]